MSTSHRVVVLIEAHRVERATARLRDVGIDEGDVHVERLSVPLPEGSHGVSALGPGRPARRGHVLLARAVGTVPGAFAGLAITLGAGLTVVPAVLMITLGAAIGMAAVTGPRGRRPRGATAEVLELPQVEEHVRLEAHCPPPRLEQVERLLQEAGGAPIERPGADRPDERPAPGPGGEDTPPGGFELAPT